MSKLEELQKQYEKTKTEYGRLGEEIEKLKKEKDEINLYDLVEFEGYEWYVISKDNELTLFMKDKFSNDKIKELFDNRLLDSDNDVRFNPNFKNIWWSDSPIRMILKDTFLSNIYTEDMRLMTTTASINGQERTTEDYVRLITKEEVEKLPDNIRECSGQYGYWTMSPSYFSHWGNAYELGVNESGKLASHFVYSGYGVRPVIQLRADINNVPNLKKITDK